MTGRIELRRRRKRELMTPKVKWFRIRKFNTQWHDVATSDPATKGQESHDGVVQSGRSPRLGWLHRCHLNTTTVRDTDNTQIHRVRHDRAVLHEALNGVFKVLTRHHRIGQRIKAGGLVGRCPVQRHKRLPTLLFGQHPKPVHLFNGHSVAGVLQLTYVEACLPKKSRDVQPLCTQQVGHTPHPSRRDRPLHTV